MRCTFVLLMMGLLCTIYTCRCSPSLSVDLGSMVGRSGCDVDDAELVYTTDDYYLMPMVAVMVSIG